MIRRKGLIIVLSAPSGTGKSTICERLLKSLPNLKMSISYTTREPRPGEIEGVHYYFVDREKFEEMIKRDEFVEWAQVYGNYYGTSKSLINDIVESGKDVLLDIDTQGAKNIKKLFPESVLIFILPPSIEELKRRLKNRGELPDTMAKRLLKVGEEVSQYSFYDYLVVNDDLGRALEDIISIIRSEKLKVSRLERDIIDKFLEKTN